MAKPDVLCFGTFKSIITQKKAWILKYFINESLSPKKANKQAITSFFCVKITLYS